MSTDVQVGVLLYFHLEVSRIMIISFSKVTFGTAQIYTLMKCKISWKAVLVLKLMIPQYGGH